VVKAEFLDCIQRVQQFLAAGDLEQAARNCKQAASLEPANGEVLHMLGMITARQGNHQQAIHHLKAAIKCEPGSPVYGNNLGIAYCETGQFDEAMECYKQVIALHPDYVIAHKNLGQLYLEAGDFKAAKACFSEAISRSPQYAPAYFALGNLFYVSGQLLDASANYQKALEIQDDPGARFGLANALGDMGACQKAADLYQEIEAVTPDNPGLQNNLAKVLLRLGRAEEAVVCYDRAIALQPDNPMPRNGLGMVMMNLGLPGEAIEHFRKALANKPDYAQAHSNLLLNMNYIEDDQEKIYAEALQFDVQQRQKSTLLQPSFANIKTTERKLRIGYVSGDFRSHSVAYFALSLLEAHNRDQFEIYCYSNNPLQDHITERFKSLADHWAVIRGVPDQVVANQIRSDQIDILVDLTGHSNDNRIIVFMHKPAPVQVCWLGYANTSGLQAMDYRITDQVADPIGEADDLYTEQLVRLPGGFLCYQSDDRSLPVSPPPQESAGHVTFGSFNMLRKITTMVIDTWSEILRAVPNSRLIMKAGSLEDEKARTYFLNMFDERGIALDRLELLGMLREKSQHFGLYSQIDIALDTFPYNGATTTCEALWMGVPVITLSGRCHVGRLASSILHQVGLTEFIAHDQASYLSLAQSLADDVQQRAALRANLRERMQGSALMNPAAFALQMENTYRHIWGSWCEERG
jgi:predicted O-linked N-acetylglucosamine transferase (SPINDLY family)